MNHILFRKQTTFVYIVDCQSCANVTWWLGGTYFLREMFFVVAGRKDGIGSDGTPGRRAALLLPQRGPAVPAAPGPHGHPTVPAGREDGLDGWVRARAPAQPRRLEAPWPPAGRHRYKPGGGSGGGHRLFVCDLRTVAGVFCTIY